jgi:hypothetical protein
LIECLLKNAPEIGKTIVGEFSDIVFIRASRVSSESLLSGIFAFIAALIMALGLLPYTMRMVSKKRTKEKDELDRITDKYDSQVEAINYQIREYMKNPEEHGEEIDKCLTELTRVEGEIQNYKSLIKKKSKPKRFPFILILVVFFVTYIIEIIPVSLLNDFNRDIKMIKPYTDNKTVLLLESDWTRMKSKDDYDKIYETIDKIKEEHNLPNKEVIK